MPGQYPNSRKHLQVVERPFLDPLGLDGLALFLKTAIFGELPLDAGDSVVQDIPRRRKKSPGMDDDFWKSLEGPSQQGVDRGDGRDAVLGSSMR